MNSYGVMVVFRVAHRFRSRLREPLVGLLVERIEFDDVQAGALGRRLRGVGSDDDHNAWGFPPLVVVQVRSRSLDGHVAMAAPPRSAVAR